MRTPDWGARGRPAKEARTATSLSFLLGETFVPALATACSLGCCNWLAVSQTVVRFRELRYFMPRTSVYSDVNGGNFRN